MDAHLCNYCRNPADMLCVRCHDWYCSMKCQSLDWPQHKLFCFPMPSLTRPAAEKISLKSQSQDVSLRPPSPSSKFRNLKLTSEHDATSKANHLGSTENIPKTNETAKSNGIPSNPTADLKTGQQPMHAEKENIPKSNDAVNGISPKPAYFKTDNVEPGTIRKPGTLSQVMPKPVPVQQKVEPPKQVTPSPKQDKVEPPKQMEPPKPQKIEPPKQEKVEPPKPQKVEPPKPQKVEPPKPQKVEPPKPEKLDPPKVSVSPKSGPWMKPFPMEENAFNNVTVQYVAADGTAWVSLVKKEEENTNLLRKCNKMVAVAGTPTPNSIQVNSLYLVPFEDIYYRGVVLKPVAPNDTVFVRLVDFGNEFDLPVHQLKTALPSVSEANAYAFPIKFQRPRPVEIGATLKVQKVSTDGVVTTVIVDGEPVVPSNVFSMKDIDVVPLPEGVNQNLICLDFSNVGSGYVSLCVADAKAVQFIEEMGPKMSKYCEETKDEHRPVVDELCLAKFNDEGWFRALTRKVTEPNKFEIVFIDYGNITTVTSSQIRKITDDFTHPCLMNEGYIKDYPKKPTKEDITKAALYFDANQAFRADRIEMIDGKYFVSVKF